MIILLSDLTKATFISGQFIVTKQILRLKKYLRSLCDLFEFKHTQFFYSCIFHLPCIIDYYAANRSFYMKSRLRKIQVKLLLNCVNYRCHGNID